MGKRISSEAVVAVAGMGRLGRTLAELLPRAGYPVRPWRRGEPYPESDVVLLTVSDHAIAEVAADWPRGPVILHTSGVTDVAPLRPHEPAGSLHPLQSFPGPEVAIPPMDGVPAAIAGDPAARVIARELASGLGMAPFDVPGDRRLYHAAAVVAGNFATVLIAQAARLLAAAGVPPEDAPGILAPLALASISQAGRTDGGGPAAALTGPFARGDVGAVAAHVAAMNAHTPDLTALYGELGRRAADLSKEGCHISAEEHDALIRCLK